ncbi:MAG: primosomal protein N' [Pseudomonadota bacterium]
MRRSPAPHKSCGVKAARILFPIALPEPFDYALSEGVAVQAGAYVKAPLGKTERTGVVWDVVEADPERELKPITLVYPATPMPSDMRDFIDFAAKYTVSAPGSVLAMALRARGALNPSATETVYLPAPTPPSRMTVARQRVLDAAGALGESTGPELAREAGVSPGVVKGLFEAGGLVLRPRALDPAYPEPDPKRRGFDLTAEQAAGATELRAAVAKGGFDAFLLDGVTGSGKTEVYFEAISEALSKDPAAQILVLLPEIALTQAILERFENRFGAAPTPWHSGLSEKERRRAWREVNEGRARIVVGARSALFLPYRKLKLIVVDEEHDGSYKQEDGVTYHARDLSIVRGKMAGAVVVLASATPSLETTTNAALGRYKIIRLAARPGTARLPDIDLIDMRADPPEKGHWLSPGLSAAMRDTYDAGEQSLLFLNRRGYAPLVLCRACGEKLKTPGTESWLTEHRYTRRLVCHLTGWSMPKPTHCPKCGAENTLMGIGPGVERVAEEARKLLPQARIAIFSSDTAQTGAETRALVERMADGEIDVLIGTQIVAKGHNFPNLTLVGVVDADSGLKGGDLRAGERTFQLLSQVAGRAGRAERPGRALIQTFDVENPAMAALAAGDRDGYLAVERMVREELTLPPFGRMAAIVLSAPSAEAVHAAGLEILKAAPNGSGIDVFGPAEAPIAILRGRHRRRFLIRSPRDVDLSAYMAVWKAKLKLPSNVRVSIDIEPYTFM